MSDGGWYVSKADSDDQIGPLSGAGLIRHLLSGAIRPEYFIWRDGMNGWQPASVFTWLLTAPAPEEAGLPEIEETAPDA